MNGTRLRNRRCAAVVGKLLALAILVVGLAGCAGVLEPALPGLFDDSDGGDIARELEEADIVKLVDGFFYVANPFTGLRIIDASDIDQPQLMGRVALGGRAVELFVRDDTVYVLASADALRCAGQAIGFEPGAFDPLVLPEFSGSRLWIVDASDKSAPAVDGFVDFDGFVTATRRVGDVIYAAGNGFGDFASLVEVDESVGDGGGDESVDGVSDVDDGDASPESQVIASGAAFVTSIDTADPADARVVETVFFVGDALDVHVRDEAMFVFGDDPVLANTSIVSYVDVSDRSGDIVVRDQIRVPGRITDRFLVDAHEDTLRVITEEFISFVFTNVVAMYVYDVSRPDDIVRLSRLPIVVGGSLRAGRFDGVRGYVETAFGESPLSVLDISDPSDPVVAGTLSIPGFGTQLHPIGDRLLTIGFDGSEGVRPSLSLFDVSDPTSPRALDRLIVGESFAIGTQSTAAVDEKALRVLEDAGLVLLPFSTFDRETALFTDSVLFVQLGASSLVERGAIEHVGFVRRADLLDDRIWILSDRAFQSVDVADLDAPRSLGLLEFLSEQQLLDAGLFGCARANRDVATRVDGVPLVSPCGTIGMIPFLGMLFMLPLIRTGVTVRTRVNR
jgi:hypothetical protein